MKSHSPLLNRRNAFRLPVSTGKNRVHATSGSAKIELVDLSASGGQILLRHSETNGRPDLAVRSSLEPLALDLPNGDRVQINARVVHRRSIAPGVVQVGASWCALGEDDLEKLTRFIHWGRLRDDSRALTVKNPMFIRNLLGQRPDTTRPILSVLDRNLRSGAQLQVQAVAFESGRRVIRARLLGDEAPLLATDRSYEFVLGGAAAVTVFESNCLDQKGSEVTLALPAQVSQKSGRESRRIGLTASSSVTISFFLPGCQINARIDGVVADVTRRGLCFQVRKANPGLSVGDEITSLDIQLPKRGIKASAVVRNIVQQGTISSCGLELLAFDDPDDAVAWRRFVFDSMHPNTVDGKGRAERSWAVLEASKYVDLWTEAETRDHVRDEYVSAWQDAHSEVGHSLLLYRRDSLVGAIAGSVAYPRSWILHHLARDGRDDGKSQAPLKEGCELISGIVQRLKAETDFEHFLIYIERDKRFNERLYVDFAESYFDKSKLMIDQMEVFRRATDTPVPCPGTRDANVTVSESTPALMSLLAARFSSTVSPLERQALALDEARIDLVDFSQACAQRNHRRQRHVFFAGGESGNPQAALIAETGSEGANIFGLLNACRIVALNAAPPSEAVREALLRRAIAHYQAAGKKHFLLFEETGTSDSVPASLGFNFVSGGLRWIAHRDVLPAWSAYLDGLMAAAPATAETIPVARATTRSAA